MYGSKRLGSLVLVFVAFGVLSGAAIREFGYLGVWAAGFRDLASLQILVDLMIACTIVSSWMAEDARRRGWPVAPWMAAVLLTGSVALLAYLILRELLPGPGEDTGVAAS